MSKNFLFYSSECRNCKKLLDMINGTMLQNSFIYIDIHSAKRLPHNLQGVPAILPSLQPETSLLQGRHAFTWVQSAIGDQSRDGPKVRGHPNDNGPQNPRSHGPQNIRSYTDDPGHGIVDSGGVTANVTEKDYLGNAPFEMGGRGYSDKYSFIDDDSGMSHRYEYVNGHSGPGEVGKSVTHEPGEALKDAKGISQKTKQFNNDLKRLQEERDSFGQGIRRM